ITPEAAKGRTARELVPGIEDWWIATYAKVALGGETLRFENRVEAMDRWFNAYASPVKGQPGRFTLVFQDISERKRAEEALRQSEEKYRRIYQDGALGIFHSTFDGKIIDMNPALARMFGYDSPEDIMGSVPDAARLYADPQRRSEIVAEVLERGEWLKAESRYVRKDASIWYGNMILRTVLDEHGAPQHLEGFIDDISERKHAEAAQHAAEMKYRTLVEQIPAVTYIVEFQGRKSTTFISPQIHALLGYTAEEWLADRSLWAGRIHPDDQEFVQAHARSDADELRSLDIEFRMIARDGRVRWVHNTATSLLSSPAQGAFSIGMLFDITARKQAEAALRDSEERLRLAQQAAHMGTFDVALQTGENVWTPELEALHGLQPGEFDGTEAAWQQRVHPDDLALVETCLQHAYNARVPTDGDWRVVWPDG
ncbi:MAG TPA: PAS domain S-box protein, partial [Roseiflexaceae bacterium]|nr:PAS domain S-box protein [Roseiflexaceae bacterium]